MDYNNKAQAVLEEIEKVVIGKNQVIEKIFMAILASGHVLMEDVPGVGKTTTAMAFARALGLETKRVQFTSDTVPSDIIGFSVYDKASGRFVYKPGAVMTNLLLADEINRTSSKTQSALLEAMEERHVSVDGETHALPEPFIVLATQNPAGSAGTQLQPNSQERHTENPLDRMKPVLTKQELEALIRSVTAVEVAQEIYAYITRLAQATREHPAVQLGVSPRGALAVCRMAKAYAFLHGRDYAVPEDVAAIFPDVAAHRLMLGAKARMMEIDAGRVVAEILENTQMPAVKTGGK